MSTTIRMDLMKRRETRLAARPWTSSLHFPRSLLALRADRGRGTGWILALAAVVAALWGSWAAFSRVTLYQVTADARVELDGAVSPIDAPFSGRVVTTHMRVGQHVTRGEVLLEMDSMPQQLEVREAEVGMRGLEPQISELRAQIAAEENMRLAEAASARSGVLESQSRIHEAEIPAQYAEQDLARITKLYAEHLVSTRDLERAQSELGRLRVSVSTLKAAAERITEENTARSREHDVRIGRLQEEIATLNAQRDSLAAQAARLNYEIDRHRIRSPIEGLIGEAAPVKAGSVAAEGQRLGSIIPAGRLHIAARYPASAAFGRIRTGQPATLRLDAFPWAEFGVLSGTVTAVAQEARDGQVRVEASMVSSGFRGTVEHGMPGTLEILVERISPWDLVLRTAGQWLTRPL